MSLYFFMLKKTPLVVKTNRLPKGGVINSFEWGGKDNDTFTKLQYFSSKMSKINKNKA